jgi:hypothetical protein
MITTWTRSTFSRAAEGWFVPWATIGIDGAEPKLWARAAGAPTGDRARVRARAATSAGPDEGQDEPESEGEGRRRGLDVRVMRRSPVRSPRAPSRSSRSQEAPRQTVEVGVDAAHGVGVEVAEVPVP